MTYPFVTVWIIARNEESAIWNTLKYIIAQDYPKDCFEFLLVNGDSTDNTAQVALEVLKNSDLNYRVVNTKDYTSKAWGPNFGPCFARNLIIDLSSEKAEHIAFIDADCRANTDWLSSLVKKIESVKDDKKLAGVWGSRYVEHEGNISNKELILNYYFTSCIVSMWNPAFCHKKVQENQEIGSIAGYNSIYKKSVLEKYRYDDFLRISDDVEINYRIKQDGWVFLYTSDAIIYHREEAEVHIFLRNMKRYGINMANVVRKHKSYIRPYVVIAVLYFFYIVSLPLLSYISHSIFWNYFIPFLPFILVFILSSFVFLENYKNTKSLVSLYVFLILPLHPFMYAYGLLLNLSGLQKTFSR